MHTIKLIVGYAAIAFGGAYFLASMIFAYTLDAPMLLLFGAITMASSNLLAFLLGSSTR